ncbi:MAG: hypothetical protein AAF909_07680, partial [Pseudomonadota bacterium]
LGRMALQATPLKTDAQKTRRRDLFETVSLAGFASALSMTPETLLDALDLEDGPVAEGVVQMTAATGSADFCARLAEKLLSAPEARPDRLAPLIARLEPSALAPLFRAALKTDGPAFQAVLACAGAELGAVSFGELEAAPGLRALTGLIAAARDEAEQHPPNRADPKRADPRRAAQIEQGLAALGVLADAAAAAALRERFVDAGLPALDPKLALLSFNAALTADVT